MKVYVVIETWYESFAVHGVFSSIESAEKYVDSGPMSLIGRSHPLSIYDVDIEEHEVTP